MDWVNGEIQFSASDLVGHLACRHLTALNCGVTASQRQGALFGATPTPDHS